MAGQPFWTYVLYVAENTCSVSLWPFRFILGDCPVGLGLRRGEGRLRFGSASSLEQHPAANTISCIICPQRPMHYRNENSFSDSLHCLARSNLAVRNSWPCRVGQWKGETRERPVLTQISHCERIRFRRLSLTTDCQGLQGELPGSRSLWLRQLVISPFYLFIFLLNGTKR